MKLFEKGNHLVQQIHLIGPLCNARGTSVFLSTDDFLNKWAPQRDGAERDLGITLSPTYTRRSRSLSALYGAIIKGAQSLEGNFSIRALANNRLPPPPPPPPSVGAIDHILLFLYLRLLPHGAHRNSQTERPGAIYHPESGAAIKPKHAPGSKPHSLMGCIKCASLAWVTHHHRHIYEIGRANIVFARFLPVAWRRGKVVWWTVGAASWPATSWDALWARSPSPASYQTRSWTHPWRSNNFCFKRPG